MPLVLPPDIHLASQKTGGSAMRRCVGLVLAALAVVSSADAATVKRTNYRYYPVAGATAYDINQSILRHGPKYGGLSAYGVTTYDYKPSATCSYSPGTDAHVGSFKMELEFQIKLPKLSSEQSLRSDVRSTWGKFASFVKSHEETHRRIWMGCAKTAESKIQSLRAKSCSALTSRIDGVLLTMAKSCNKKHEAFDAAEQKRLTRHPFMQKVRNGAQGGVQALKTQ
jgi:predicted secreted Zn-dependent protease